ncbi:patatin-like phospholipase family protein, partial [Herbaspirillum sp. 3C11]|uniref:patatin-like phospholipase family protein n=2 Tax=unclassified Herbaspirillum TaxID=2624150 RepID=UPI0010742ED0
DLGKGTEVILERGSLPRAMRASMAVPGLFAPYPIDGRTLVDGGLVSNLPVQEARDMGADVIIAVNIATPLQDPANLQSPTAVAQQMVGILIQQNVKAQKALLGKSDVLIEPELSGMSFTDFARGKDGVNAGWNAAQKQSTRLTELSLPPVEWQAYLAARQAGPILARDTRVDAIEIKTTGRIPAAYVRSRLSVKEGDVYDADKINQQLSQLATNGDFNALTQEIVEKDGRHVLLIDAEEKSWGPQYLLFGLGISNTFDGRGSVNLQIGHRYPWMNQSGLEWRNDLLLGNKRASLHSELRQPVFGASGLYVSPYVDISRRYVDAYLDGSDAKASPVTQYRIDSSIAGVDLGMPLARLGDLRLGVSYQHIKYTPTYNLALGSIGSLFDATQSSQPVARARLTIDQLDDPLFPRKGYYIYSEINRGFGQVDNRYSDAQLRTLWAFSSDRNTFNVALEAASNLSSNNAGPGFFLGGFQRLSAYAPDQFYGSSLLYSRLTYLRDLTDYSLLGLRNPVLGSSLEAGNVWQTRNAFGDGPYKKSLSLFLGGNSPVGPVYFGAAVGQQAIWNLYLQLGRVF